MANTVTVKTKDGETRVITRPTNTFGLFNGNILGLSDGYKYNNFLGLGGGTASQLNKLIDEVVATGVYPSDERILEILGRASKNTLGNLKLDLQKFLDDNNVYYEHASTSSSTGTNTGTSGGTDINTEVNDVDVSTEDALKDKLFNDYFSTIYSISDGTLGGNIYQNLANIERSNAIANMELADAQAQQLAMQQAEATKALADQVRSERMAKLRAGMNESQIANQEMQSMMSNMQAMNQQVAATNAARLQASQQYNLAQQTAYQQWLQNANAMAQTGAAYSAADAGDAMAQARAYAAATKVPLAQAYKVVTGQNTTTK